MVDKFPNVTLKEERDFLYQPYQCKSNPSTWKYFHANHQHPAFYARWQMTSIWVNMLCISHVCANSDCDTRLDTCHQRISLPFVGWCVGWKSCSITHPLRHNRSRWRKQAKNLLLCFCSLILFALMCTGRERKENRWNNWILNIFCVARIRLM